jgi:hypothetical protein
MSSFHRRDFLTGAATLASNPPDVLATNFGKPAALFEKFPRKDVFITDKGGH